MLSARLGVAERSGLLDDALLCVSELVTNAVHAGCGMIGLGLMVEPGCVRIGVHDGASGTPEMRNPAPADLHGRGLLIVDAVSNDWGVEAVTPGKEVWAQLAR